LRFLKKLIQCFFVWRVPPSGEDALCHAEVALVQSFGLRRGAPGLSNGALASIARNLHEHYGLPLVLQWEIADCLPDLQKAGVIRRHRTPDAYLDTREVLVQSAEICRKHGWRKAIIVAHPDHVWRVMKTAEKLDFGIAITDMASIPYDSLSLQPWTRSRWRFVPREIIARLLYLVRGWI